jgi:hypothetical protein
MSPLWPLLPTPKALSKPNVSLRFSPPVIYKLEFLGQTAQVRAAFFAKIAKLFDCRGVVQAMTISA